MIQKLKANLEHAQSRIKYFADRKRTDRSFNEGDLVFLKIQPYRQNAFGLRGSLKLWSKFYGPYKIIERIGSVAYKLLLQKALTFTLFSTLVSSRSMSDTKQCHYLMFHLSPRMDTSKWYQLLCWTGE